ncbi:MAG: elongation factor 1-beta [Nanoarchaeota archaeon]
MGTAVVKIKVMPTSPEVDLERIKQEMTSKIGEMGGKGCQLEEEPIAFGLKAIIVLFAWPEEAELENLEESLQSIEDVNSVQVIDIRRAIG